jgi:hypothetical protein
MANVLNEEKKQQILALGRLGWSLRRIQQATQVRRETISGYLKAAGITVWRPGGWSRQGQPKPAMQVITDPAKPAMQVITGSMAELPTLNDNLNLENLPNKRKSKREDSKPAIVKVLREQSFRLNRIRSRGCYLSTHTISYGAGADAFP